MSYTPQEKVRFVLWLTESNGSYAAFAIRVRRELGIHAKVPDRKLVLNWKRKLVETGSAERKKVVRTKFVRTEEKVKEVWVAF